MIATVNDPDALRAVSPLDTAAYLRASGWRRSYEVGDKAAVWIRRSEENEEFEILLPLDSELRDYPPRIGEALRTLELLERRSQLDILSDLLLTSADVVRVPMHPGRNAHGTVPIEVGVPFLQQVRAMMLAAACAAMGPRSYFRTRKPEEAEEYLDTVELGPSERGSYVFTVLSPVPPAFAQLPLPDMAAGAIDDPFPRRVTRTLTLALETLRTAALRAAATDDFEPLQASVEKGVSANLCDAVSEMTQLSGGSGLDVRVTWARTWKPPGDAPSDVRVPGSLLPVIREASRRFKETAPEPTEITGYVAQLRRDLQQEMLQGPVWLACLIDGKLHKVRVELSTADHQRAVKAYEAGIPVHCYGELVKEGGSFTLRYPYSFSLQPEE